MSDSIGRQNLVRRRTSIDSIRRSRYNSEVHRLLLGRRLAMAAVLLAATVVGLPDASARAAATQLPLLVVLRTPDLAVGTYASAPVVVNGEVLYGCDPYEHLQQNMTRCLRFDTIVANLGYGALELRYAGAGVLGRMRATQRVYRADHSHADRSAGYFYWDVAHGHFHYADFEVASLWRSDLRGHRLGSRPVRAGRKDGFCLEDLGAYAVRSGAQTYQFPAACYPTVQSDGSLTQVNGISPGWLDGYDETLTNQSVEISGLADGYYLLQISVDPRHTLLLDRKSRLSSWQLIRLCGDKADLVGRTSHCAAPRAPQPTPRRLAWRSLCVDTPCPLVRTATPPVARPKH